VQLDDSDWVRLDDTTAEVLVLDAEAENRATPMERTSSGSGSSPRSPGIRAELVERISRTMRHGSVIPVLGCV